MLTYIKARALFLCRLYKEGIAWKIVSGFWGILSLVIFFRDDIALPADDQAFKVVTILHSISFQNWFAITLILFLIWFFESSFQLYKRLSLTINELGKIDKDDLCHLLNGYFFGNRFAYRAELVKCEIFTGKFNVQRLVDGFVEIGALAPKFAIANIKIRLHNGRSDGEEYKFYLLDTRNKEIPVNDRYDPMGHDVYLDENSKFSIKLKHNELFEIDDSASVWVTLNSWTK